MRAGKSGQILSIAIQTLSLVKNETARPKASRAQEMECAGKQWQPSQGPG